MSTLTRWNPIREMAAMQSAMDRIFDETLRGYRSEDNALAVDVYESDSAYLIQANLPGVDADDIHVNMHDGTLTISAEIIREENDEKVRTLVSERRFGTYTRSLRLPQPVDMDGIEAQYQDGVLSLNVPKVPEAQPRQIPVRAGRNN